MSEDQTFVTIESAARSTGISARTLRYWITTGKLTATAERRGKRVMLADVERIARVTGKLSGSATVDPASVPGSATATAEPLPVAMAAEQQLQVVRDTLLRPLIEQNERQQATITDQAETIGRVTTEREQARRQAEIATLEREQIQAECEALEARLGALEAQRAETPVQASSALVTATDAATARTRKPRQRRWWLRLFGVDE